LFDHEEVGSTSGAGADGSFLEDVLERVSQSLGDADSAQYRRALAQSFLISADMAHAWNPNFPAAYEPTHRVLVNRGPVIKTNANQRYSTRADTAAAFMTLCQRCDVPFQHYVHRTDLGCGSTIGPLLAARLGVPSVDVGAPMWAMHSARESAGVVDHALMTRVLRAFYRNGVDPLVS
jgi:aspartyl aminopeptidase